MKKVKLLLFMFSLLTIFAFTYDATPDDIVGKWVNPDGGRKIEIFKKDNFYFGKIISVTDKGAKVKPGDIVLKNITYKNSKWKGTTRIPAKDNDYETEMEMPSKNQLQFTIKYGLLSRTKIWTRIP